MKWTFYPAGEFERHAESWDALNACGFNSPLLSSHFLRPALHAFGSGTEKLAVLGRPEQPDAMCILVRHGNSVWNTFQPSQAPTGFWLMRPGLDLEGVLTGLLQALPGFPLVVGLTQQDPLMLVRPLNSARLLTFDYITVAYLLLHDDYETFWHARSSHIRKDMRHVRNRLEANGLVCKLKCVTGPEEVEFVFENFARMESAGWKAEAGTAVRFDSAQGKFYVSLLKTFCQLGAGCVYYLTFNDAIVAMDVCIHNDDTVFCLKTSYDPTYRQYSPGMLLHQEWFRMVWQSGALHCIDFGGRSTDWEMHLTDQTRTLYHVNVYRWAWLRRLAGWRIDSPESDEIG